MWFHFLLLTVCLEVLRTSAAPECSPSSCSPCRGKLSDDGTCCGFCDLTVCIVDGTEYRNGDETPSENPCLACRCVADGSSPQVMCASMACAPCLGDRKADGTCCGSCVEGCKINETVYANGDDVPQDNPCKTCTCVADGKVPQLMCAIYDCFCEGRVTPDETCCGICEPGCFHEGSFYSNGEDFPTSNPCATGLCQNGVIEFMEMACAYCMGQWTEDGTCCGICEPGCIVDGILYREGEDIPTDDPCSFSNCENGEPLYIMMSCAFCPGIHTPDGTCCGQCTLTTPRYMTLGGPLPPSTPQPECDPSKCPKQKCPKSLQFQSDEMCCPQCKCKKKGKKYLPGPVGDKCDACECNGNTGKVFCTPPKCPANVECIDPVKGEDCCLHCPDGRRNCRLPGKKPVVLEYGVFYRKKKIICTCAGEPWYPLAFCADLGLKQKQFKSIKPYFPKYIFELGKNNK